MKTFAKIAVLAFGIVATQISATAEPELPTYRAVYRVERDGKNSGTSEWSLSYDAERDVYRFTSSLAAKGVLRLALPKPIVERAELRYENGAVVPIQFFYEDGTRGGEDNFYTAFDWSENRAITVAGQSQRTDVELRPGVLDRASVHVALMRDLASGSARQAYTLADGDTLKTYGYARNGQETVNTPAGTFVTEVLVQEREGSSRRLLLWMAPELGFLPVRMEQQKNGETDSVFVLEHVEIDGLTKP